MSDREGRDARQSGAPRSSAPEERSTPVGLTRRSVLRRVAAGTAGIASVAGCGGRRERDRTTDELVPPPSPGDDVATATPVPPPFDSVTDLSEFDVDPTGGAIGNAIEEVADDGDLLVLPEGTFTIEESLDLSGLDRFGLVGNETTLVPTEGASGTIFFISAEGTIHVSDLRFDYSANGVGSRALDVRAPGEIRIRDVTVNGRLDGGRGAVRIDVTDPDGTGLVERLRLPDGSVSGERVTGCYVGDDNRGEITFADCRIVGFSDNGLYADPAVGRMVVDGGYYANSGISNVRVCAGSVVRNVHVRCDDHSRGFDNMRGIRLNNAEPRADVEPTLVENCRIEMIDVSSSDGGIILTSAVPSMVVRNTEIRVDADGVNGIWAKTPAESLREHDAELWVDCEDLTVTGDADDQFAVKIDGRGGSTLTGIDVSHAATNRNGIGFQDSYDNVIRDATVEVGGIPVLLQEATVELFDTNVQPTEVETLTEDEQ
ncbi:hypothetical protein [Halobellus rufus]|uniref:hypothetical protein n=1 Tax=Halobellus rufus TaxID=1448860 RepID=UPI0006789082|nr:hypothetical protein [Halobellus rufus]